MLKFQFLKKFPRNFPKRFEVEVGLGVGEVMMKFFATFRFRFRFSFCLLPRWVALAGKVGVMCVNRVNVGCRNRYETEGGRVKHSCSFVWKVQVAGRWSTIGCE